MIIQQIIIGTIVILAASYILTRVRSGSDSSFGCSCGCAKCKDLEQCDLEQKTEFESKAGESSGKANDG